MENSNQNKKNNKSVAWRDAAGKIECPGDSCPEECDENCPVYLNTQALTAMQIGVGNVAILFFEKAIGIAPDFYDAWNNLGGVYGEKGKYQKAYDCYKKAHELNTKKPNPVFGLMLTSRDLGKYKECIEWCDVYNKLSNDGREVSIRNEAKKRLGK